MWLMSRADSQTSYDEDQAADGGKLWDAVKDILLMTASCGMQ